MTTELPDFLIAYFARRMRDRADAVNARLATFTDRERALIREAAVMGYVRGFNDGQTAPGFGEKVPGDMQIVADVIDACLAAPDLYPTISGHTPDDAEPDDAEGRLS